MVTPFKKKSQYDHNFQQNRDKGSFINYVKQREGGWPWRYARA